jgi:HD-like signal output (HDOD) protein
MSTATSTRKATFVQHAASLPAMPEVAQRLLASFDRDDLSMGALSALISRDQALAAKVLRLANSARYSPQHTITALGDAAAALGLRTLRDLTMSACLAGSFPVIKGFDRLKFWGGTLALGQYAQTIAKQVGANEDTANLAGMMLRTGQVLMQMSDPALVVDIVNRSVGIDSRIDIENECSGCNHPELTAELARRWSFPTVLSDAFAAAAAPMDARPFNRLGAVLRLASVTQEVRQHGRPLPASLMELQGPLVEHLRLDLVWLDARAVSHDEAAAGVAELLS